MNALNLLCLRLVRWSSWPLLAVLAGFLLTGYAITGQYGLDQLCAAKTALTLHRMLHGPLLILLLVHCLPAVYLALQRWGWIRHREAS
ncbi:MAG: hypothetical protein M5U12_08200 [Verrucomicrobia bacterium]|nr:hypothetical protein [Verrucomicrobiota bacterium]